MKEPNTTITAEGAKQMYCPLSFASNELFHCRAERCMGWRWHGHIERAKIADEPTAYVPTGYCGMVQG